MELQDLNSPNALLLHSEDRGEIKGLRSAQKMTVIWWSFSSGISVELVSNMYIEEI